MKALIRSSILLSALILPFSLVGHAQEATPIDELRQQIQKLVAIDNDPSTSPEIRRLNRGFLDERRAQLHALLQKKLAALQSYQVKVSDVLTAAERQTLGKTVKETEDEIRELEAMTPTNSGFSSAETDRPRVSAASPSSATGALVEISSGSSKTKTGLTSATNSPPPSPAGNPQSDSASNPNSASSNVSQGVNDFNNWLNNRIEERIKANAQARIDQRSNVNQTEAPSIAENSTSLVDQSSASDLIGVALNLAGLSNGNNSNEGDKNSAAVTATAYSLYSMFRGEQPLDPSFYNRHRNWRRLSFTLGFEKGQKDANGNPLEDTTIAGAKYLIVSRRDAVNHQSELATVYEHLKAAAVNLAQLHGEITDKLLFGDPSLRDKLRIVEEVRAFVQQQLTSASLSDERRKQFQDLLNEPVETWFDVNQTNFAHSKVQDFVQRKYFSETGLPLLLKGLDDDGLKQIDQFIDARLEAFTNLNNASQRAIERIRKAPQFSLSFLSKLRREGADEYKGEAIFEYGIHNRVNLTLNGGYFYKNSKVIGGDLRGANFAGQLQFQMTPEKSLAGRNPLYFFLASEGNWVSGKDFVYKVQGKVKIPIVEGIDFPISLTYASKKNLIQEKDVRGQFGFTFDTAKLLRAFLSR